MYTYRSNLFCKKNNTAGWLKKKQIHIYMHMQSCICIQELPLSTFVDTVCSGSFETVIICLPILCCEDKISGITVKQHSKYEHKYTH